MAKPTNGHNGHKNGSNNGAKEAGQQTDKDRELSRDIAASGEELTDNQGLKISDDRNSLKAGVRGPSLLEDFYLREKITHFDHERIPERVVHARGSGAHGFFQVYEPLTDLTAAKFLQDPALQTPVFVRFSTVAGSRGSADTARDVRGFAVKFYTPEGNFDLVGNNMPVFFIQDAIKFPDMVHAAKPEPHNEIPQASTAHDTFWDFISLTPESMHMIMWIMSDRAIPRSLRMMEGFGVHTFRLVNAEGKSHFVKFHWKPLLGVHSLVWDEAQKLAGKDPDFHRRDLWEAIENGAFPEWELGLQVIEEGQESQFDFDILDATKIWPEDLIPVRKVGKMTLNRNPDNFFAETEQVAFHLGNVVPGIDFSDDPLLQGRLFSYLDTQLLRLGGPNFTEIPINRPIAEVSNNQRDGFHRQTINKGRVSYQPNSLDGNRPAEVAPQRGGYVSYPEQVSGPKIRQRSESFGDHYGQARLFWNSMSPVERKHIISALQFELSKVETREVRVRMLEHLAQISDLLASEVALVLGETGTVQLQKPPTVGSNGTSLVQTSASGGLLRTSELSQMQSPRDTIKSRKIALLMADGVDAKQVQTVKTALEQAGAMPVVVALHLGTVKAAGGEEIPVDMTFINSGSVMFDAFFVPGGGQSAATLGQLETVRLFVAEGYKHGKAFGAVGEGLDLLTLSNVSSVAQPGGAMPVLDEQGVVTSRNAAQLSDVLKGFIAAVARHRHFDNRMQPEEIPA